MKLVALCLAATLISATPATLGAASASDNSITSGPTFVDSANQVTYIGSSADGVEQFQNIYFAQSTAGKNRFAPPQPFTPAKGSKINATAPGPACPQARASQGTPFLSTITDVSEDCLSLRIARPQGTTDKDKLPVMVYLYGGASTTGTAYDKFLDPVGLVQKSVQNGSPTIYAAVNYRVSVFGYAASKALQDAKSENNGLRDQRAGIQWVHDHAHLFGGDCSRITAFGQSAGATDIAFHIVSYAGAGTLPFQRGILESGVTGANPNVNGPENDNHTAEVAKRVGCIKGSADSQATVDCLRNVPFEMLLNTSVKYATALHPPLGFQVWQPKQDNDYIPDLPSKLLSQGRFSKKVEMITGWNTNDGSIFAGTAQSVKNDSAILTGLKGFFTKLSDSQGQHLLQLYPVADFQSEVKPHDVAIAQFYRASRIFRDVTLTCPALSYSYALKRFGQENVRLYELNQTVLTPLWQQAGVADADVSHYSDIPYIFNEVVAGGDNSPAQRTLAGHVSGSCSAFATSGNPEFKGKPSADVLPGAWPTAYASCSSENSDPNAHGTPAEFQVYIIGGPSNGLAVGGKGLDAGSATMQSMDGYKAPWANGAARAPSAKLQAEKLYERCSYINGLAASLGV